MPEILRDGARTAYWAEGSADAPAVVFGHAQILNSGSFRPQAEMFAERYRIIAPDFRGHGRSPVSPGPYVMEDLAADVVAVMDAEGVGQAHYCGSSLGGMVGFALALEHRSRLASVTFLATQGRLPTANGERLRATAKRLAGGTMAPVAEETLARYTTEAWRRANPDRHAALVAMASGNPAEGYAHSGEAIIAMDYDGRLGDISTPTLVVAGEHDMPTPPERMALYLEGIAGARMATIAEAGHFPNWDRPEAFNAVYGAFLSAV